MSNAKKKYYALDDVHEIVSEKATKKRISETDQLTKIFFAKRRSDTPKKKMKEKA